MCFFSIYIFCRFYMYFMCKAFALSILCCSNLGNCICLRWWGWFFWIATTESSKHKCLIKMLLSLIDLIPSMALNVPLRRNTWLLGGLVWNKSLAAVCSCNDYRTRSAILFVYSLTVSTPLMRHISFFMNIFNSQKCN